MNEIEVLVTQQNGIIECNFEEIKEQLSKEMDFYSNLVFTEDQKTDAKKDVANLRKLKTAIEDKRKEVKKAFMVPYEEFESKVKELTALIDKPIALINEQVNEFEAKRKAEKREKIKTIYAETIGDMAEVMPLSKIYKSEWENTKTSDKSIKTDIEEKMFMVKQDMNTIKGFESDCENKALEMYYSNGYQINPVIAYINQYEKQKKEVLEREQARKEAEAIRLAEEEKRKAIEAEKQKAIEEERMAQPEETQGFNMQEEQGFNMPEETQGFVMPEVNTVNFVVTGTAAQIDMVRDYLKKILVEYKEA